MGNQLFQFAAGYALARRLDVPLRCDGGWTPQPVLGPCLGDRWVAATPRQLWSCGSLRTPPLLAQASRARRLGSRLVGRTLGRLPRRFEVDTPSYYDSAFERLTSPTYLLGYFQHQGYWADVIDPIAAMVCDELSIADQPSGSTVGIHIRRGDYLAEGWALGPAYYRHALDAMVAQVVEPVFRVIGADAAFVVGLTRQLEADGYQVDQDQGPAGHPDPTIADLIRLAECDHLVTSNSSFAWWGGALGDHVHRGRRRLVVLPAVWPNNEEAAETLRRPDWVAVVAADDRPGAASSPYRTATTWAEWWADRDDSGT